MALRILVPVDNSEPSRLCEAATVKFATILNAEVTLFHAVDTGSVRYKNIPDFQVEIIRKRAREAGNQFLSKRAEQMSAQGINTRSVLVEGAPGEEIAKEVNRGYDFAMIGVHVHSDLHIFLFGSVSAELIHNSRIPILVIKDTGHDLGDLVNRPVRVLMALDETLASQRCVNFFTAHKSEDQIDLTLVHVSNEQSKETAFMDEYEQRLKKAGHITRVEIKTGNPVEEIKAVTNAQTYDFLIVGLPKIGEDLHTLRDTVGHRLFHDCDAHQMLVPWDFNLARKE